MDSAALSPTPDFLLIGAMKAGTTSLFHDLNRQAGVFIPADKEPTTLVHRQSDEDAGGVRPTFRPRRPGRPAR